MGVIWILLNGPSGARPVIGLASQRDYTQLIKYIIPYNKLKDLSCQRRLIVLYAGPFSRWRWTPPREFQTEINKMQAHNILLFQRVRRWWSLGWSLKETNIFWNSKVRTGAGFFILAHAFKRNWSIADGRKGINCLSSSQRPRFHSRRGFWRNFVKGR